VRRAGPPPVRCQHRLLCVGDANGQVECLQVVGAGRFRIEQPTFTLALAGDLPLRHPLAGGLILQALHVWMGAAPRGA
jgi:hypothetical protein